MSRPLCPGCALRPKAWVREMGWGGHGRGLACYLRGWGVPSPLPACSPARAHPSFGSVPTLGPSARVL